MTSQIMKFVYSFRQNKEVHGPIARALSFDLNFQQFAA